MVPLSIVSNIFVMIGTFMNERFVYISSVGFCVALALFLLANLPKWIKNVKAYRLAVACFLAVVLVLYSVQTISRNRVWFDDFTLSTTDVKTSPKSAKANYDAARVYNIKIQGVQDTTLRNFYTSEIHKYSQRAVKIHPNYENALFLLSWSHSVMGSPVDTSLKYMKQLLRRNPQNPYAYDGLTQVLGARVPDPAQRAAIWEDILTVQPLDLFGARVADQFQPNYILACIYAKEVGDIGKSLPYFEKAATLNPGYVNGLIDLGAIYGLSGNHVKAVDAFRRAVQVAPTDTLAWRNLWYTYRELGEYQHSQEAYQKYREMGGGL